jgi:hypothetical protein
MLAKLVKLNVVASVWATTLTLCAQPTPTGRPDGHIGVAVVQVYNELVPNKRGGLVVVKVEPGSPAAEAGIRVGDVLISVGGSSAVGRSLQEITHDITGPAGTSVSLTILRDNSGPPIQVTVERSAGPENVGWRPSIAGEESQQTTMTVPPPQPQKQSKWKSFISALGRAANAANSAPIVGVWRGAKNENNYSVAFSFAFAGTGEYLETVYMGGLEIMNAHGTYTLSPTRVQDDQFITHLLTLAPDQCEFASSQAALIVGFMALPANQNKNEYVGFADLAGGGQMTLEDPVLRSGAGFGLQRSQ